MPKCTILVVFSPNINAFFSFRENSRFFYGEVFRDEARAMRINGFPIRDGMSILSLIGLSILHSCSPSSFCVLTPFSEETVPLDAFDSFAVACLSDNFKRNTQANNLTYSL